MSPAGRTVLVCMVLLCGCASRPGRVHRFGGCRIAVDGNNVLCGGRSVARIDCHGRSDNNCRALAVRYADGNVAWLFQAPGFDPERPESAFQLQSAWDWASDVSMTGDATYLWYRADEENGTRWIEYEVQAGFQMRVDRFRIVRLREGRYRGDVVDIPLIDPAQDVAAERPR